MKKEEILQAAEKCVCGDRDQDYGSPENSFGMIGRLWSVYLNGNGLGVVSAKFERVRKEAAMAGSDG